MKRFICVQTGARRNYAVPTLLERSDLLESFYTDLCANVGSGKFLEHFCPAPFKRGAVKRLLNRQISVELQDKVCTFDKVALRYLLHQKIAQKDVLKQYKALVEFHHHFSQAMIQRGVGEATHVFSMFNEGYEFLEFSQQQGLKTISEVYISPLAFEIVQQEREKYPELEPCLAPEIIQHRAEWFHHYQKFVNVFIVPSQFVLDGVTQLGINPDQCRLVPYAVSSSWLNIKNTPTTKRILLAGTADLRKGIHILGMAAQRLRHRNYEFRVAGEVTEKVRLHPLTQSLYFLGRVPRSQIQVEFAQADVFVLPTLAEGSAEVVYEALASGLPVITTKSAGSVIKDGVEGFIVNERDPIELANRIEEIVENRVLRDSMALAARERAKDYTWDKYAERLLGVLTSS
jgi:glycosyltransferase involved in cell wall biosynthesis